MEHRSGRGDHDPRLQRGRQGAESDWTAGCIAVDDAVMDILWRYCDTGQRCRSIRETNNPLRKRVTLRAGHRKVFGCPSLRDNRKCTK